MAEGTDSRACLYFTLMRTIAKSRSDFNGYIPSWWEVSDKVRTSWFRFDSILRECIQTVWDEQGEVAIYNGKDLYEMFYDACEGVSQVSGDPLWKWNEIPGWAFATWANWNRFAVEYKQFDSFDVLL